MDIEEKTVGEQLRDRGMSLAEEAQDRDNAGFGYRLSDAIYECARDNEYLDADTVRETFAEQPKHPNAAGSVWRQARNAGWIEPTLDEFPRKAKRPSGHAGTLTRYKSLIWIGF